MLRFALSLLGCFFIGSAPTFASAHEGHTAVEAKPSPSRSPTPYQFTPSPIDHLYSLADDHILFRSSRPKSEEDMRFLHQLGIRMIIDLQGGDYADNPVIGRFVPYWEKGETPEEIAKEREWALKYGIEFINLPLNSLAEIDSAGATNIQSAMALMNQFKKTGGAGGSLLIHCAHGLDRTGLVVALYRVVYEGWSADTAYAEFRRMGHSLANMTATWHLDEYFFRYMQWLKDTTRNPGVSKFCENNLKL